MLNAQCSMPNAKCQMLNAQCSMLNAKCQMLNAQCSMLNAQCQMPNAQCSMLNAQCQMPNAKRMLNVQYQTNVQCSMLTPNIGDLPVFPAVSLPASEHIAGRALAHLIGH
jgi:hypothetical protein